MNNILTQWLRFAFCTLFLTTCVVIFSAPNRYGARSYSKINPARKTSDKRNYYVYVVAGLDGERVDQNGIIVSHGASGGRLAAAANSEGSIYDPRFLQPSQDGRHLFVGGIFERGNDIGGIVSLTPRLDGTMRNDGWWLANDIVFSLCQLAGRRAVYLSTYSELRSYPSASLHDLRENPTVVPTRHDAKSGKPTTALYQVNTLGKLARSAGFTKKSNIPDFDAAAGLSGKNLLYHRGRLYPLAKTAYLADNGSVSITVGEFSSSPIMLSSRQRLQLPIVSARVADETIPHQAVILREPGGRYVYAVIKRAGGSNIYQLAIGANRLLTLCSNRTVNIFGSHIRLLA